MAANLLSEENKRLLKASFELGLAQRDLEEAERKFQEALHAVELAESAAAPNFREVRGILK